MNELRNDTSFSFHPRYRKNNITHILFADDMLLFGKGDIASVKRLNNAFGQFSRASGLVVNCGKSNNFFAGVENNAKNQICTP